MPTTLGETGGGGVATPSGGGGGIQYVYTLGASCEDECSSVCTCLPCAHMRSDASQSAGETNPLSVARECLSLSQPP